MLIGYARVSTLDQDTALQLDALKGAGVKKVYQDKGSGVGPRPQLREAISSLKRGDLLVVWKLDRVARSLSDLLGIIDQVKQAGASIKSLTEPIDTSNPIGQFTLQVLGAVAELERAMIRERTIAGQVAAFKRGKSLGRNRRATPPDVVESMRAMYAGGGHTFTDVAHAFGVARSTATRAITGQRPGRVRPIIGQYL